VVGVLRCSSNQAGLCNCKCDPAAAPKTLSYMMEQGKLQIIKK
jgi:hypothetical protein